MPTPTLDLLNLEFCGFDLETTGVNPLEDKIVTANITVVNPAEGLVKPTNWLANPGIPIPDEAAKIHGITNMMAQAQGREHGEVVKEISQELTTAWSKGQAVVAFNAAFDLTIMSVQSGGHFTVGGLVIDPLVIDKALNRRRGSRKLMDVARFYGLSVDDADAHTADFDALVAVRLAWKMMRLYANELPKTVDGLMDFQRQAKQEQFYNLKNYLESVGKEINGDAGWPVCEGAAQRAQKMSWGTNPQESLNI